jgi:hypothetical protein
METCVYFGEKKSPPPPLEGTSANVTKQMKYEEVKEKKGKSDGKRKKRRTGKAERKKGKS